MLNEYKLEGIAQYLTEIVYATDNLEGCSLTKDELIEAKAGRSLALHLLVRFNLEENLGEYMKEARKSK